MAYGLPAHGEANWDTKLNASVDAVKTTADTATTDLAAHKANVANPHAVTKAQVGLGNVDNTSDANKPVSTAQQAALDGKISKGALVFNVKDYGALGNGTADDTAAITATIAAAAAAGGGVVFLPPGTYKATSTLTVSSNGVFIQGAGAWLTTITRSADYGDTLKFTGNDGTGVAVTDTGVSGIQFRATGLATSGAHLNYNGVTRHTARDLYFESGFIGIKAAALTAAHLSNIYGVFGNLYGGTAPGRRYMVFTSAAAYPHPSCGDVFLTDVNMRGNGSDVFQYGIEVQSSDGIWFQGGHTGDTTLANILLNATDAAHPIDLLFFTNMMSDACTGSGVLFTGTAATGRNIMFANCMFKGGGRGAYGIETSTTATFYNVQFTGCTVTEFNVHGARLISAACANWSFSNCQVRGNSYTTPAAGSGYNLVNVRKVQITGGCSGGDSLDPEGTAKQGYGIIAGAGVTGILITGVDLRKNVTGGLAVNSGSLAQVQVSNCLTDQSTSIASASTVTLPETGEVFTITGTTSIDNVQVSWVGRRIVLRFTGTVVVKDAGNLKLNGQLNAIADTTLSLFFDGTNWLETGRSVN